MTANEESHSIYQAGNKESLLLWCDVVAESVRQDAVDLSSRQMAVLLIIYTQNEKKHTIKSLADELKLAKPPVCRAVDFLQKHKFIKRRTDKKDRRIVLIEKTEAGFDYLDSFSGNIMDALSEL